jgi:hypothetical protein
MLICFSIVALWLVSLSSPVSAQVLIDGHWYPINPNVTVPSGDLDVPKNNPTQKTSTSQAVPTAAITIYITNTPPPPFVPASGSVPVNPTPGTNSANSTTSTTQSGSQIVPRVTLRPGYVFPTSVLNQFSAPANAAVTGSILGTYTRGERWVLDFIKHLNNKVDVETVRIVIRVCLSLLGLSVVAYSAWRWKKNRDLD